MRYKASEEIKAYQQGAEDVVSEVTVVDAVAKAIVYYIQDKIARKEIDSTAIDALVPARLWVENSRKGGRCHAFMTLTNVGRS